jgi:hypothetical protein
VLCLDQSSALDLKSEPQQSIISVRDGQCKENSKQREEDSAKCELKVTGPQNKYQTPELLKIKE